MKSLLLVLALTGLGHSTLVEWTAEDYPNPQTQPAQCGRHPNKPSYVCDPNRLISTEAADFLDHILLRLPNDTQCPCSTKSCEEREHSKGYIVAIALVRKLKRPEEYVDSPETRQGLVRSFVFNLLRKHWNSWATCDELTVIVFSKEDNILMTLSGTTPRRKLTEEITYAIQFELARFFREKGNVGQGLHYVVMNYRRVLDGEPYLPIMYADVPVDSAARIGTVAIVTSLLTTLFLSVFC